MFNSRSNSKLPFYKSYTKKSFKQKQKWLLRISIVAIICIFLLGRRWHNNSQNTSSQSTNTKNNTPNQSNSLEVQLRSPATSDARDFKELTIARETNLVTVGGRIPKIVHFVYGLRDPDPTLDLIHYTSIKSAHDVLKPDKIMFHYHYMPVGANFERALPMLTLNQVPMVTNVFDRPVSHYAHKADVVRLQVLEEFGGIYLDLDLISLKPVDHLLDREFIMAQEGVGKVYGILL
jgi:mannosyltransferase OCH1-like enzyme